MTLNFPQPGLASSPASASHGPSEPSGGGLPGKSPPRLRIFQDCRSYPRLRASLALFAMPGRRGCPSLAVLICSFSRSLVASPSPTHSISRPSGAMGKPALRMPVSTHGGRTATSESSITCKLHFLLDALHHLHHPQSNLPRLLVHLHQLHHCFCPRISTIPPRHRELILHPRLLPSPLPRLFQFRFISMNEFKDGLHSVEFPLSRV